MPAVQRNRGGGPRPVGVFDSGVGGLTSGDRDGCARLAQRSLGPRITAADVEPLGWGRQ